MQDNSMDSSFSSEDVAAARENARHFDPRVRAKSIGFLLKNGPCSWDDIQNWALDSSEDIRWQVFYSMKTGTDAAGYLCESDKVKCLDILKAAAEKYADMQVGLTMRELAECGSEWLALTWEAADELVDNASPELRSAIMFGYLERLIPEGKWGPDDPHIRPWIKGGNVQKKMLLLKIAAFRGLEEGRMKEIVGAISQDGDPYIASLAQGVLGGSISHGDIPG